MKYFMHAFVSGKSRKEYDGVFDCPDTIGAIEIDSWKILENSIRTHSKSDHPKGIDCLFFFAPGNRFYIVENRGQCQEPNGDIIWRNEDGAQGDEKLGIAA